MIHWREWSSEAFHAARQENKPVLLTLSGAWCHWCHVMDETSYSDPRVISLVNSRFIPVRVDVDQRPDISRRYNQGGYPSIALLTDQGEVLAGRVYTPPEEMLLLLEQVSDAYSNPDGPSVGQMDIGEARSVPANTADNREPPVNRVLQRLEELYDSEFGGLGREPKQPPWEALRLFLARYSRSGDRRLLKMVVDTLDSIRNGLYDHHDQGFFRYSVSRDWRVPHYEKMLVTNANLAVTYFEAYQVTGKRAYKQAASGALDYLSTILMDPDGGLFYASQDAGEEYYRLPWKDRAASPGPSIDRTHYTGWNAQGAASLIKAFAVSGQPAYLRAAGQVLDLIWSESWNPDDGLAHVVGEPLHQPPVLEDHVHFIRALLALHQATGHSGPLQRAVALVNVVQERFSAPDGGFYDISDGSSPQESLLAREKSVLENALLAEALVTLFYLTGEDKHIAVAKGGLETFLGVVPDHCYLGLKGSRRMEEDEERLFAPAGSAWARAWDLLTNGPVHLVIVGPSGHPGTRSLLQAALKVYLPHQVVQVLDPEIQQERVAQLGFPTDREPSLYACMDGRCLAPVTTPREVRDLAAARPWAALNPP